VVDKETMKVQKRKVTTGDLTGTDSIQILSGLKPGEKIALTGVTLLREGMQVRDLGELEGYGR
jgi:multidrug efflux pump subunit AcrA (membrane-fusion protein)